MYCSQSKGTKYYFVKGQNNMVTASGDDVMISENAEIAQRFDRTFKFQKPGTGYFYAEDNIGKHTVDR